MATVDETVLGPREVANSLAIPKYRKKASFIFHNVELTDNGIAMRAAPF